MKNGFTGRKCPKCGGNLYLDSDYYIEGGFISWYEQETCLQCGFSYNTGLSLPAETVTVDKPMPAVRELVAV